jgi:hypothetical protein
MMNKFLLPVLAIAALTGCDAMEERQAQERSLEAAQDEASIAEVSRNEFTKDAEELKAALAKLQATDKSVVDMYYKINADGDKTLVVVRNEPEQTQQAGVQQAPQQQHSEMAMINGMMLGMMMQNISNAGGMSGYRNAYPASQAGSYSPDEARRQRNSGTATYVGAIRTRAAGVYRSSPTYAARVTARSNGAFANAGSARSGGYSAGG